MAPVVSKIIMFLSITFRGFDDTGCIGIILFAIDCTGISSSATRPLEPTPRPARPRLPPPRYSLPTRAGCCAVPVDKRDCYTTARLCPDRLPRPGSSKAGQSRCWEPPASPACRLWDCRKSGVWWDAFPSPPFPLRAFVQRARPASGPYLEDVLQFLDGFVHRMTAGLVDDAV